MKDYKKRVEKLFLQMRRCGIKQKELAEISGITREHLNRVLNYKYHSEKTVERAEKALADVAKRGRKQ